MGILKTHQGKWHYSWCGFRYKVNRDFGETSLKWWFKGNPGWGIWIQDSSCKFKYMISHEVLSEPQKENWGRTCLFTKIIPGPNVKGLNVIKKTERLAMAPGIYFWCLKEIVWKSSPYKYFTKSLCCLKRSCSAHWS